MYVDSSTGERFELNSSFNQGGEAVIWSLRREPSLVAKLYHQPTVDHEAKLKAMVAAAPAQPAQHPTIAWPLQLLYQRRRFVGYLMPRVQESRPLFHFYNPARRVRLAAEYPWRYFLHRTAQNLAAAVQLVHDTGHVIGDLNEGNVLVNREALVTLVDSDSFQIQGALTNPTGMQQLIGYQPKALIYRSLVGKPEFTAPELQGVDFKTVDRTPAHDNFALAIMIFCLLMEGHHPYAGVVTDALKQRLPNNHSIGRVDVFGIRQGLYPHARNSPLLPPPHAPKIMWLAPDLQAAFHRAFAEGHNDADRRPTAQEWRTLLADAESTLVACPTAKKHIYSSHLGRCPHCDRDTIPQQLSRATNGDTFLSPSSTVLDTIGANLRSRLPAVWASTSIYVRGTPGWLRQQSMTLWQTSQQLGSQTHHAFQRLPGQLADARHTANRYATLWQRWTVSHLVGVPAGGAVALGVYHFAAQADDMNNTMVATAMVSFPALWLVAVLSAIFAACLGAGQAWALRDALLRWPYLRELWVGVGALTGALLAGIAGSQMVAETTSVVTPSVTGLMEAGAAMTLWSPAHGWIAGLALLFGALLGFLQSLLLRRQLVRATDGRIWTVTNALAWLLLIESLLLGLRWGGSQDLSAWHVGNWWFFAAGGDTAALWLGVISGAVVGLGMAALLTGGVLLWLLQGPRQNFYRPRFAFHVRRLRGLPTRLQQQLTVDMRRWGRALLLCALIVFVLEMVLAVGW